MPASSITLLLPGGEEVPPLSTEPESAPGSGSPVAPDEELPYPPSGRQAQSFEDVVRSEAVETGPETVNGGDEDRFPTAPSTIAPEPVVLEPAGSTGTNADATIVPPVELPEADASTGRGQEREKAESES